MNHCFWWWGSRSFWKDRECATAFLEQVSRMYPSSGTGWVYWNAGQVLGSSELQQGLSLRGGWAPEDSPGREGSRDHSKDDKSLLNRGPSWQMVSSLPGKESPFPLGIPEVLRPAEQIMPSWANNNNSTHTDKAFSNYIADIVHAPCLCFIITPIRDTLSCPFHRWRK